MMKVNKCGTIYDPLVETESREKLKIKIYLNF